MFLFAYRQCIWQTPCDAEKLGRAGFSALYYYYYYYYYYYFSNWVFL
jgi:hypothetical protein